MHVTETHVYRYFLPETHEIHDSYVSVSRDQYEVVLKIHDGRNTISLDFPVVDLKASDHEIRNLKQSLRTLQELEYAIRAAQRHLESMLPNTPVESTEE